MQPIRRLLLLLARLIGQYCFARCRLSASSVVVCKARGRSGDRGRHCRAGQYGYAPLGRDLVKSGSFLTEYSK